MSKRYLVLLAALMAITTGIASADTTIRQIQSPIYTDDIGRSHFLGKGGYSSVRHMDMGAAYSSAVNEVANEAAKTTKKVEENISTPDIDITNAIKEKNELPVSSRTKATFSTGDRQMDPSASFGQGATYLPSSGVNKSKTMYTDDLGRLHFFGKGNLIKE